MPHLPLTSPALPMRRRPDTARDPRRRWAAVGSVLLHLLALAALLIARAPEPPMPVAPSYDLLFENGGSSTPPTAPDQALDTPSEAPAAESPSPEAEPPAARATPVPPLEPLSPPPDLIQPEPVPAPSPTPSASLPDLVEPEPNSAPETAEPEEPQPEPAEPAPAPKPEPPAVRLAEPKPVAPPLSPQTLAPDLPPLAPPTPPLPAPTPPHPRQQAQQRPAPGTFAAPMDLNFGRAASHAPAPRAAGSSHAIDFSLGPSKPSPNKSEAFFDIRAANIGADWAQNLTAYARRHGYYPEQAAQNGEEGSVEVTFTVNRLGRVENVEIQRRSGSPWLDMATVALWRNAQLPPLPPENTDGTITVVFTGNYTLIRR